MSATHSGGSNRKADPALPDFYPTPSWVTDALLDREKFTGTIWEPACGNGAIVKQLEKRGHNVYASDLFEYGFGETGKDFFSHAGALKRGGLVYDNLITNPPFKMINPWISHSLEHAKHKVAIFARLAILESDKRWQSIFSVAAPNRIWVFSQRITMYPHGMQTAGSGTIAFCWLVWDVKNPVTKSELDWIPSVA